jgi:hypothetical protein
MKLVMVALFVALGMAQLSVADLATNSQEGAWRFSSKERMSPDIPDADEDYDGVIDEVRIYNYALTPDAVSDLYTVAPTTTTVAPTTTTVAPTTTTVAPTTTTVAPTTTTVAATTTTTTTARIWTMFYGK